MEEKELIDMKSMSIGNRPNIGVQDMDKYTNGGLTVELLEVNGALVYIPYGIYCDVFRAMESGMFYIRKEIESLKNVLSGLNDLENKELSKTLQQDTKFKIKELEKHYKVLENIEPIINDV